MYETCINCQPSLTEDHLLQLHAALMTEDTGSKFSMNISTEDNACVPRILDLMSSSDWAGDVQSLTDGIKITAHRN